MVTVGRGGMIPFESALMGGSVASRDDFHRLTGSESLVSSHHHLRAGFKVPLHLN
jgi:hypothetical protein